MSWFLRGGKARMKISSFHEIHLDGSQLSKAAS
jgi:hypothetical protein